MFVGTPHQLRGRAFRVVFVPGLAERVFPQRVREDPLLPDESRRAASDGLVTRSDRTAAERLLLRLAIGAATDRLYLSYPRLGAEMGDMRPRVPSFYALDVMRAITGRVPDYRALAAAGRGRGRRQPRVAGPARSGARRRRFRARPRRAEAAARHARRRSGQGPGPLSARVERGAAPQRHQPLGARAARVVDERRSDSGGRRHRSRRSTRHRLGNRPYSLSALQRFATCPYQFLLAAIHRIQPWDEPQPVVRMDPLTRGSLFHRAQAEFFRALEAARRAADVGGEPAGAIRTLHEVVDRVAAEYADELVPAIDRVWRDEIDEIRRDLGIWVQRLAGRTPSGFRSISSSASG